MATEQQNKPFLSASVMSVNGTEFPAVKNIVKDPLLRILQKNTNVTMAVTNILRTSTLTIALFDINIRIKAF